MSAKQRTLSPFVALLVAVACSGSDDVATETSATTSGTSTSGTSTSTGSTGSTGSTSETSTGGTDSDSTSGSSTGPVCTPGSEGCECGAGDTCDAPLVCQGGVCVMPPPATCGDGKVDRGEECDDGGESATCDADCSAAACGDGTVNAAAGEACDDGGESATCNADCSAAACGDGTVNMSAAETCDDQGESMTCDADCSAAECGDGTVNMSAAETCDDQGESMTCDADCSAAECGDSTLNKTAGEACDGDAPANATCKDCSIECDVGFDDCNMDLGDGCEIDLQSDAMNCGMCKKACGGNLPCKKGKCVDTSGAFKSYDFEGRTVYIYKTPTCADLTQFTTFCQDKGLSWWKAKSQADAQQLVTFAYNIDSFHTWIQVYGAKTTTNPATVDGYSVTVDGAGCVDGSADGWTAFRKWACSFCEPANNQNQSCCWDKGHAYDWFVCEL